MSHTQTILQAQPLHLGLLVQLEHAFSLPAAIHVADLELFWSCNQSTVSRRLQAFRASNLACVQRIKCGTYWIDPLILR